MNLEHVPAGAKPGALDFAEMLRRANVLANSGLVPAALRGKPEAVALVGARGAELGVPFVASLSEIFVIENRPTPSAQLRLAIIRRAGHEVRFPISSSSKCVARGRRREDRDDPDAWSEVEWTIEDAARAKLDGKDVWKRYPASMLRARAICALGSLLFSDVLLGMGVDPTSEVDEYVAESSIRGDLGDEPDTHVLEDDEPVDAELVESPTEPIRGEFVKRDGSTSETYEVDDDRTPIDGDVEQVEQVGTLDVETLDTTADVDLVTDALEWSLDDWRAHASSFGVREVFVLRGMRDRAETLELPRPLHLADHHGDVRLVAWALETIEAGER